MKGYLERFRQRIDKRVSLLVFLGSRIRLADAVAHVAILALETLGLLLEGVEVSILLSELVLQFSDFAGPARLGQALGLFAAGLGVAFVALDFLLEAEGVRDHDVGAVQDEGEEEREAAEVHVALGVEFAGLDFHAAGAFEHGGATGKGGGVSGGGNEMAERLLDVR